MKSSLRIVGVSLLLPITCCGIYGVKSEGKSSNLGCSDLAGYMFLSSTKWSGFEQVSSPPCLSNNILFFTSDNEVTYRTRDGGEYLKYSCSGKSGQMTDYYKSKDGSPPVYDGPFQIVDGGVVWQNETLTLVDPEEESGSCPALAAGDYEFSGKKIEVIAGKKVPVFHHEDVIEPLKYLCVNSTPYFTQGIIPTIPDKTPLCGKVTLSGSDSFTWLGETYKK